MKQILKNENGGVGLTIAIAFMALGVLIVSSALGLASTLSIDSRIKTALMKSQYAAYAGSEYSVYRLLNEPGFMTGLAVGAPDTHAITINGLPVTITTERVQEAESIPAGFPSTSADSSRRLKVSKVVSPTTAPSGVLTTFTYTITVSNQTEDDFPLTQIWDVLPSGFTYLTGSTSGITTNNPSIAGSNLNWTVAGTTLAPGEAVSLTFQARASLATGNYCNLAYVEPGDIDITSSGKTAMIKVGNPGNDLCPGYAHEITKSVSPEVIPAGVPVTVTYTVSVRNYGTNTIAVTEFRDFLPAAFEFVPGSTSSTDFTFSSVNWNSSQWRATWTVGAGTLSIAPGQTKSFSFQATGTASDDTHWDVAWANQGSNNAITPELYTWPAAPVRAVSRFDITVTQGEIVYETSLYHQAGDFLVEDWEISD